MLLIGQKSRSRLKLPLFYGKSNQKLKEEKMSWNAFFFKFGMNTIKCGHPSELESRPLKEMDFLKMREKDQAYNHNL